MPLVRSRPSVRAFEQRLGGRPLEQPATAALRVPAITAWFWVAKALSTAFGESASDSLVRILGPVPAVLLGAVTFSGALAFQLRVRRYRAVPYWLAVVMVGVFGTMAADVVHVGLGVPYVVSAALAAIALGAVFAIWWRSEGTLSVHTIDSNRRELFYWSAVGVTFALGTAVGDLTAITLHLGYTWSIALFAALITVPIIGFARLHLNPVRDLLGRLRAHPPTGRIRRRLPGQADRRRGRGWGSVQVSLGLAVLIVACVAHLAWTRCDVQAVTADPVPSPA